MGTLTGVVFGQAGDYLKNIYINLTKNLKYKNKHDIFSWNVDKHQKMSTTCLVDKTKEATKLRAWRFIVYRFGGQSFMKLEVNPPAPQIQDIPWPKRPRIS